MKRKERRVVRSLASCRLLLPLSVVAALLLPSLCSACGIAESQAATGGTLFATFKEALQPPPTFDGTYVPILMYHRVEEPPSDSAADGLYFVSPKKFRQQMRALDYHGYTPVTMQQVWDYWHGDGTLPEKTRRPHVRRRDARGGQERRPRAARVRLAGGTQRDDEQHQHERPPSGAHAGHGARADRRRLGDRLPQRVAPAADRRLRRHAPVRAGRIAAVPAGGVRRAGGLLLLSRAAISTPASWPPSRPPGTSAPRRCTPAPPTPTGPTRWTASRSTAATSSRPSCATWSTTLPSRDPRRAGPSPLRARCRTTDSGRPLRSAPPVSRRPWRRLVPGMQTVDNGQGWCRPP